MNNQIFLETEIPYDSFERMGFSQEMIDDLPESIMNKLLSGEKTPLLASKINDNNGNPMRACIWLEKNENGAVEAMYRPYDNVRDYSEFSKSQQKTLLSGGVVRTTLKGNVPSYYQMDEQTNRILSCPEDCIKNNINGFIQNFANVDVKTLEEGKPQTLQEGEDAITFGIDLSDSKGFRFVNGTIVDWNEEKGKENQLPKYNFGIYGCWTVDNDNNLSYVSEENYTDDIVKAQSELVENNKSRGLHL